MFRVPPPRQRRRTLRAVLAAAITGVVALSSASAFAVSDLEPPSTPTKVEHTASDVTDTAVNLRWGSSTDEGGSGLKGYLIREASESTEVFVPVGSTSRWITGLANDTAYLFEVYAVDNAGNESLPLTIEARTIHSDPCWVFASCPQPGKPLAVAATAITTSSATITWAAPAPVDSGQGPYKYVVTVPGRSPVTTGELSLPVGGLTPNTPYAVTVQTKFDGSEPPLSEPATAAFRTAGLPIDGTLPYSATATATLKRLVAGKLTIPGTLNFRLPSGQGPISNAALTLPPTAARVDAMGFLPVTAKFAFVPANAPTGAVTEGRLSLAQKVRIKVLEVKLYGAIPIASGNNCQTRKLTDLNLAGPFTPAAGGRISGTFALSDLNGCSVTSGLINPLIAGSDSTLSLELAPVGVAQPTP